MLHNKYLQFYCNLEQPKKVAFWVFLLVIIWFLSSIIFPHTIKEDNLLNSDNKMITVKIQNFSAQDYIKTVNINGYTESTSKVDIEAEINGRVESIIAKEGTMLKKDDPILQIEVKNRSALVTQARSKLKQLEMEFNTSKKLLEKGHQSVNKHAEITAKLNEAKANLEKATFDLENTLVKAPFDGILERIHINKGELLNIGTKVARLISINSFLAVVYLPEKYINAIELDNIADMQIDNKNYKGKITFIGAVADDKTKTFRIEVEIINPDINIREGLSAKIILPINKVRAHNIPASSLSLNDNGIIGVKTLSKTSDNQGVIKFIPVEIINSKNKETWVSGLPENIDLVILGQEYIADGKIAKYIVNSVEL